MDREGCIGFLILIVIGIICLCIGEYVKDKIEELYVVSRTEHSILYVDKKFENSYWLTLKEYNQEDSLISYDNYIIANNQEDSYKELHQIENKIRNHSNDSVEFEIDVLIKWEGNKVCFYRTDYETKEIFLAGWMYKNEFYEMCDNLAVYDYSKTKYPTYITISILLVLVFVTIIVVQRMMLKKTTTK